MANADENTNTSQNTAGNTAGGNTGNQDALTQQLAQIQENLGRMNAQMEATQAAIAAANRRPEPEQEDENLFEPQQMINKMEKIFDTRLRTEKAKDMTIYNLAQEYPEIQTDSKLRQAVLEAQKSIPESLRDTADGYELAVLKATQKAGLIPKSQRRAVEDEPSYDGRRSAPVKAKPRVKVSEATLQVAELMGRNIEDPETLKRLEDAANRDTYAKYR